MKGDFSRLTFDAKKHYSAVRMQQGRVQLDADWNEQLDISQHRLAMQMTDFIGYSGVPAQVDGQDNSFKIIPDGNTLKIGAGRIYIAGELYENEKEVDYTAQPDYPGATRSLPTELGTYLAYLDVWQRHITPLEDADIREVALGGPDTTTRIKNLWQVKLDKVDDEATSAQFGSDWKPDGVEAISTGQMMARVNGTGVTLENQLYRVEIHQGGSPTEATFKWSRDNGSVAAKVESIVDKTITISSAGRDPEMGFAAGQWVELCSEAQTLSGQPGTLVRLERVQGNELTIVTQTEQDPLASIDMSQQWIVRRWDSQEGNSLRGDLPVNAGWTLLEDEIQVQFETNSAKVYNTGDYWLIPARHLTSDIEWPRDGNQPQYQPAVGIRHHYAPLALLERNGSSSWTLKANGDLRTKFNPLIGGFVNKMGDTISGSLRITQTLQVDGNVGIGTAATNGDKLKVVGNTNLDGTLNVTGATTLNDGLTVSGATMLNGTLTVAQDQNTTLGGSLTVADNKNTTLGGALTVSGQSTLMGNVGIGTATPDPQAMLNVAGTVKATSFQGDGVIPRGVIVMWSGAIDQIPNGWALCDGGWHNGLQTPNLRNKFIVGAGDEYSVANEGGQKKVTLEIRHMPKHNHGGGDHYHRFDTGMGGSAAQAASADRDYESNQRIFNTYHSGNIIALEGNNQPHDNMPPYYALAYIIKT